ncbi:MAG: hypothetical protein ACP5P1_07030 [Acidimicrobiales bacterium]
MRKDHHVRRPVATRLGTGALGVATLGLVISACGSSTKTAASTSSSTGSASSALAASIGALGNQSSVEARFSIDVTAKQAAEIAGKAGSASSASAMGKALSSGSIFFAEQSGNGEPLDSKTAASDSANSYDFGISFGSSTPVEVRYVGQALYLHLQASELAADLGEPASAAAPVNSELVKLNAEVPGLATLASGGWVEISKSALSPLIGDLKSLGTSGSSAGPAKSISNLVNLRTSVLAAIKANSTVTSLGSTGGRQEYAVAVQAKALASSIDTTLNSASGMVPSVGNKLGGLSKSLASIPSNLVVTIDAYTSAGKLAEADVDLDQFFTTNKPSFPVPLQMTITSTSITAPSGATELNLSNLPSLVGGLLG